MSKINRPFPLQVMTHLPPAAAIPQKKPRVLIVDDDATAAGAMAELLEDLGCVALIVGEGTQARQQAQEFKPEIILLDIDLPGMNGYEVAQALRRTPELSTVLIIATTGHNLPEDKQKAYGVGMDLHLAKPIQINFFKELIGSFGKTLRGFTAASL